MVHIWVYLVVTAEGYGYKEITRPRVTGAGDMDPLGVVARPG